MKVLFDSQVFDWQISGGISRYFIEVLNRLQKDEQTEVLFQVNHSYNTYIQHTNWLKNKPYLKDLSFKGKLRLLKSVNQFVNRPYSNRLLKKAVPDIFHPTYFDPYFLKYKGKVPLVLTVHDLTDEKYNDGTARTREMLQWKKKLIANADHIITVSENTKKDVLEYYNVPSNKVTVAYLAASFDKPVSSEINFALPDGRYLLYVGARKGYKNFLWFINEVAPLLSKHDLSVVVAGGGIFSNTEKSYIREKGIESKILIYPHVSDSFLQNLYQRALFFVFPSLYEGFGIPVVEAMQNKCPVLLSHVSSLPEVGGNAARYFNPLEKGSLESLLYEIVNDTVVRQNMILDGFIQSKKFSWDTTSLIHQKVYESLI